jgi:xanthine dehydrogenase accessory factor
VLDWPEVALVRLGEPLALVTVLAVEGSAPRDAGARMLVWPGGQWGTIGGGNLEHQATAQARRMLRLADVPPFAIQDYPLGPLLGQCCGGRVRLLFEPLGAGDLDWLAEAQRRGAAGETYEVRKILGRGRMARPVASPVDVASAVTLNGGAAGSRGSRPGEGDEIVEYVAPEGPRLLLFGAGHVGLAIARALDPLPFRLDWFDSRPEVAATTGAAYADPAALAALAAAGAPYTLVLTHDHALDFDLVLAALTGGGAGYLGLIGSATKRVRFTRRLRAVGVGDAALARLVCPIGLPGIAGKAPPLIAASVAADLLIRLEALAPEAAVAGL